MKAHDIARLLAERINRLVADLLPAGRRMGHEWRCGSIAGEPGDSLGVHLTGPKAGVWADFSTDAKGDALDLVRAVHGFTVGEAIGWSRRWLGLDDGDAAMPARRVSARKSIEPPAYRNQCRKAWQAGGPITATAVEYGLIAALIAVAAITAFQTVGTNLTSVFTTVANKL
jgi:hypothetical protein